MAYYYDYAYPLTLSIADIYLRYAQWIDTVLVLIIFTALGQHVFKKHSDGKFSYSYEGKNGKAVGIAVALALTFAYAVFAARTGFYFGQLSPIAVLVLVFVIGAFIYNALVAMAGEGKQKCAFALTYLIMYSVFASMQNGVFRTIMYEYRLLAFILNLLFLVCLVLFIICLFGLFPSMGKDNGSDGSGGAHLPAPAGQPPTTAPHGAAPASKGNHGPAGATTTPHAPAPGAPAHTAPAPQPVDMHHLEDLIKTAQGLLSEYENKKNAWILTLRKVLEERQKIQSGTAADLPAAIAHATAAANEFNQVLIQLQSTFYTVLQDPNVVHLSSSYTTVLAGMQKNFFAHQSDLQRRYTKFQDSFNKGVFDRLD